MPPCVVVLSLRAFPSSIHFCPYLELVAAPLSLLEFALFRLRKSIAALDARIVIAGASARSYNQLKKTADSHGAQLLPRQEGLTIELLAALCRQHSADHAVIISLECAFAPIDTLERTVVHHFAAGSFTRLVGFPRGCTIEAYSVQVLDFIQGLNIVETTTPAFAVETVLNELARTGNESQGMKVSHFDGVASYRIHPGDLPESVVIHFPADMRFARLAAKPLMVGSESANVIAGFQIWKLALLESREIGRRESAGLSRQLFTRSVFQNDARLPIRVLFVSAASGFSGPERSLCEIIRHLDRETIKPYAIVMFPGLFSDQLLAAGADVNCLGEDTLSPSPSNVLRMMKLLLEDVKPHVIHFNGPDVDAPSIFLAAGVLGIPAVQHLRSYDIPAYREQLLFANSIIAVSEFVKLRALALEISKARVEVLLDEVDTEFFNPENYDRGVNRTKFGFQECSRVVVMVARYEPYKRHDVMLNAARSIRKSVPMFHLVFVGEVTRDVSYYMRLRKKVESEDLVDLVSFIPFQEDIRPLLSAADVLVLCSDGEPCGRSVAEASSMGLPVVVTNSGGTHELVCDGKTGWVVESGSSERIAERIISVLLNPVLACKMGRAARHHAINALSVRTHARRLTEILLEAVKDKPVNDSRIGHT